MSGRFRFLGGSKTHLDGRSRILGHYSRPFFFALHQVKDSQFIGCTDP